MKRFLRWWWHGDPEGLERAKQADQQADQDLHQARHNGRRATQLLVRNSLTERFLKEIKERHA